MEKLKYILYYVIIFTCVGMAVTLEELIQQNIYTNPQIKASIANYKISKYELEKVSSGYSPTLDITAEIGRERTKIDYGFEGHQILNEQQLALVGRYNLFEGYKTTYKLKEKESAIDIAKHQLFQKISKVTLFMTEVYLELLRKKALLEIEEENYQNHLQTLNKVRLRLEAGDGYESDYRQSNARLKLAEGNRLLAKRAYLNTQINYRRFLAKVPIIGTMERPMVSLNIRVSDIEKYMQMAKDKNFNLHIQKSQIEESKSLYQQEKSKYYPTIDVEISQSWNNNIHGVEGNDNSQKIVLLMNYNLYNGRADQASQLSALKRTEMQEGELDNINLDVEEELRLALMKYNLLERQLELGSEQLGYLKGTKELYELEYQYSKRTIIDVLNIKQEYSYAQAQKINAEYDQLLAYYQFKSIIGGLMDEFHLDEILEYL